MKEKTKNIMNTVFLLLFVVTLIIGFSFPGFFQLGGESSDVLKYDKFKFVRKRELWSTNLNNKEAVFNYHPTEVEDIQLEKEIPILISNKYEIDTTSDANDTFIKSIAYSQYELANVLNIHRSIFLRIGMTSNNTFNLPLITCNQSTEFVPIIYFKQSNQTMIYVNTNSSCIIAESESDRDIIRIKDRLLYSFLGIIG